MMALGFYPNFGYSNSKYKCIFIEIHWWLVLMRNVQVWIFDLTCYFLQMLSSKDVNFVGYTYKNFEIVNDDQLPEIGSYIFNRVLCFA